MKSRWLLAALLVLPNGLSLAAEESSFVDSERQTSRAQRLLESDSAYLRQHADNPIDWYPWTDDALRLARDDNRLIFLSIGYASCHWCHVMEAETFSDPEIGDLLRDAYVSIKVDREQMPDLDRYYALAVEAVKGESGWPVTIVLLPDRKPVFAANYLSRDEFASTFLRLARLWGEQPDTLKASAALLAAAVDRRFEVTTEGERASDQGLAADAARRILSRVDTEHGGFGADNKFPHETRLQFLLNQYKRAPEPGLRQSLIALLDANMNNGMNDAVYGGIFRYTTDRAMTRPHFEKMLYNQALTVRLYSDAAKWLERPVYLEFAMAVIRFAREFLRLPDGRYAAAIDADHNGIEGGFYLWPLEAVADLPDGLSTISLGQDRHYPWGAFSPNRTAWQQSLRQLRSERPRRIDNVLTAWNALWILALLESGEQKEARTLAETLWMAAWSDDFLRRMGGQAGFLDDYAYLSLAFWKLYLHSGDTTWQHRARLLDRHILDFFYHEGRLLYRSRLETENFPIDHFIDRELPGPAAAVIECFSNHQTELDFIEAWEQLRLTGARHVGTRPELYPSLINTLAEAPPAARRFIAKGHGFLSLERARAPGKWHLDVNLDEGWHINASEVYQDNLIATRVETFGKGITVEYPQGDPLETEFSDAILNVYSDDVRIGIETPTDLKRIEVEIRLQACSHEICLLPETHRMAGFGH
jgi:uncharacterized protein YyaL (SSP411 family)